MGAPLMSDIKINKDYFFVPMMAILPLNWDKWYETPVIGQDVPNDCGPSVEKFWDKVGTLFNTSYTYLVNQSQTMNNEDLVDGIFKLAVFFERFYSDGSLMSNLGIHGGQFFGTAIDKRKGTYDDWFNNIIHDVVEKTWNASRFSMERTPRNISGSSAHQTLHQVQGISACETIWNTCGTISAGL